MESEGHFLFASVFLENCIIQLQILSACCPQKGQAAVPIGTDSAAAPHELRHDRLRKDNTPSSQKSSVEAAQYVP